MTDPPSIVLNLPVGPSTNRLHITVPGMRRRQRSPEYNRWIERAGWEARRQAVGFKEITGTFEALLIVPSQLKRTLGARRDRSNWDKCVWDLLQYVHIIRNDSGKLDYAVKGEDRTDMLVLLWDRGGPEQRQPRTYSVSSRPPRPTTSQIAHFEQRVRRLP